MVTTIGFIGAGGVTAWQHFPNIERIDGVEVVGICDIDESTRSNAAERFDAAAYTDSEVLCESHDLDAVFVAVPPFAHGPPEHTVIDHGIDLFVEKPLGLDIDTARKIGDAADNADIVTQVGYMNRYADVIEQAKSLIGDRTVSFVSGRWIGGVPDTGWWGVAERSGGQVVEQSTHIFDLVRYFAGEVDRVDAYGGQEIVTDKLDFPDTTTVSMHHTNGAVSHVLSSSVASEESVGLELAGEGFQLDVDLTERRFQGTVDGEDVSYDGQSLDKAFRSEVSDFFEAVRRDDIDRPRSPYADAERTFALTLAVNESMATNAPVSLGER